MKIKRKSLEKHLKALYKADAKLCRAGDKIWREINRLEIKLAK